MERVVFSACKPFFGFSFVFSCFALTLNQRPQFCLQLYKTVIGSFLHQYTDSFLFHNPIGRVINWASAAAGCQTELLVSCGPAWHLKIIADWLKKTKRTEQNPKKLQPVMAECVKGSLRHLLCVPFMHCRCFLLLLFFSFLSRCCCLGTEMSDVCVVGVSDALLVSQPEVFCRWVAAVFFFHFISFHFIYLFISFTLRLCQNVSPD